MTYWRNKVFQYSVILWPMFFGLEFNCIVDAYQLLNETRLPAQEPHMISITSFYFLVEGDVHQSGLYHAAVQISGDHEYFLDIDTGSDLSWISCSPSNIQFLQPLKLYLTPHQPYETNNKFVSCEDDTMCGWVSKPGNSKCSTTNQQCDYQIEYADHGSSLGVLVKDTFLLESTLHGPVYEVNLTFGCGYHQEFDASTDPPFADGVLGIGNGKTSILSQLFDRGAVNNAFALCLSRDGPGYLVFGYSQSNTPGIIWMPILQNQMEAGNMIGPANLFYDGKDQLGSGLRFLLDSGTTYNYFSSETYQVVLSQLRKLAENVATPAEDDPYLPVCWKPLTSSSDVFSYFSPLRFNITDNVYFQLESWDYLVNSPQGNVCLGILDGQELGPGLENVNIIGDVSFLDKLVIYDYEKQQVGWVVEDCMQVAKQLSGKKRRTKRNSRRGIPNRHKKMNEKKRKRELPSPGNM